MNKKSVEDIIAEKGAKKPQYLADLMKALATVTLQQVGAPESIPILDVARALATVLPSEGETAISPERSLRIILQMKCELAHLRHTAGIKMMGRIVTGCGSALGGEPCDDSVLDEHGPRFIFRTPKYTVCVFWGYNEYAPGSDHDHEFDQWPDLSRLGWQVSVDGGAPSGPHSVRSMIETLMSFA